MRDEVKRREATIGTKPFKRFKSFILAQYPGFVSSWTRIYTNFTYILIAGGMYAGGKMGK